MFYDAQSGEQSVRDAVFQLSVLNAHISVLSQCILTDYRNQDITLNELNDKLGYLFDMSDISHIHSQFEEIISSARVSDDELAEKQLEKFMRMCKQHKELCNEAVR